MKLYAFAVFDKAVNAYMQPFYARSTGEAIRSFTDLANDPSTNVAKHPTDFVLYGVGAFDDNAGLFESVEPARLLAGNEVLKE